MPNLAENFGIPSLPPLIPHFLQHRLTFPILKESNRTENPVPMPHAKRLRKAGLALILAAPLAAHPQANPFASIPNNAQNPAALQQPTTPQTVSGTVLDSHTGQPIFRALVKLAAGPGQRLVLTDSAGHFTFANVEPTNIFLSATKPGYTNQPSAEFNGGSLLGVPATSLSEPAVLRLSPESVLTGTVTDPQGNPVPNVRVTALRSNSVEGFGRQITPTGFSSTNSHGRFRIVVPAGDYRVESAYTPQHTLSAKPVALMPTIYPEGDSLTQSIIHLAPGEEHQIELHPDLATLVKVVVHGQSPRDLGNLTAFTQSGSTFPLHFMPTEVSPGISELTASVPLGTFTVRSTRRGPEGESMQLATLKVTSSPTSPIPVTLQFLAVPPIPIEVTVEDPPASNNSSTPQSNFKPNASSLGLRLEPLEWTQQIPQSPSRASNGTESFVAPPGTYRLRQVSYTGFYIQSATFGDNDVLRNPILVAVGAAPTTLRLTVSNQTASIRGSVTLNGAPTAATVYAIPNFPTATVLRPATANQTGSFMLFGLQPGEYTIFALLHKHTIDPTEPASYERYSAHSVKIKLNPADTTTAPLNLEAIPDEEPIP